MNKFFDSSLAMSFIDGVTKTLTITAQTPVKAGAPQMEFPSSNKGEVAGVVGMIDGSKRATLTVVFSTKAILKIMENMLGEKFKEITPEVCDAVSELVNQIYGLSKTSLNANGYAFNMAIPTVVKGDFVSRCHLGSTMFIPFSLSDGTGDFLVEIALLSE